MASGRGLHQTAELRKGEEAAEINLLEGAAAKELLRFQHEEPRLQRLRLSQILLSNYEHQLREKQTSGQHERKDGVCDARGPGRHVTCV